MGVDGELGPAVRQFDPATQINGKVEREAHQMAAAVPG